MFDRGDLAGGCPLLDEAYRLDGALLGAGYALAECHERQGRLATAHRLFLEIENKAASRGEARAAEARQRAESLAPRLPRLRLVVSTGAGPDLEILVDGVQWPRDAWGADQAIDAGRHEVVARGGGLDGWSRSIDVREGARVELVVELVKAAMPTTGPVDDARDAPFPWRTAGFVTGAVGLVALGGGVALALVARGDYEDVASECDPSNACSAEAATARNDAVGLAGVATALVVVGGVLAGAGLGAVLLAPSDAPASASVRVGPSGASIVGRF